jgi:hypothetical protein
MNAEIKQNPDTTIVSNIIGRSVTGYVINSGFSVENGKKLERLMEIIHSFEPEAVWCPPTETLHISLMYWVSAFDGEIKENERLFERLFNDYDKAFQEVISGIGPIEIDFRELKVCRDAVIAVGYDDGSFKKIRDLFFALVPARPGTKPPPNIIHSSLCRFLKEIPIRKINDAIAGQSISFKQKVDKFTLFKVLRSPMLEAEAVKEYRLR